MSFDKIDILCYTVIENKEVFENKIILIQHNPNPIHIHSVCGKFENENKKTLGRQNAMTNKKSPKMLLEEAQKNAEEKKKEFDDFIEILSYSRNNQALIFFQCPWAKEVKGYRQWKKEGRQVQKGENGISIFAPLTRKAKKTNDDEVFGFRLVSVFDISQTKLEEGQNKKEEASVA